MHTSPFLLHRTIARLRELIAAVRDDHIPLYAAQASFFVIISAVPFLSLLFAAAEFFLPDSLAALLTTWLTHTTLPTQAEPIAAPPWSLLSLSAVTTLWSASRGLSAVRAGIETIYRAGRRAGFFARRIRSIVETLVCLALVVSAAALYLFGDLLFGTTTRLHLSPSVTALALLVFFTLLYAAVARRSSTMPSSPMRQLPGAVFSAAGWILFTRGYALYLVLFPRASSVYGNLAAVCLIFLWLYFCLMILLLGALCNRLYAERR